MSVASSTSPADTQQCHGEMVSRYKANSCHVEQELANYSIRLEQSTQDALPSRFLEHKAVNDGKQSGNGLGWSTLTLENLGKGQHGGFDD